MAFDLKSIYSGSIERPNRIILIGEPKVGKSTFASQFPKPVFLQIMGEEGIDAIDCAKFPVIETIAQFQESLEALCGEHDYKTLVVDSISALEPIIWKHICKRDRKENIESYGYGKGFNLAETEFKLILEALDYLRNQKNMEIIFIAHSKIINFNDPAGDSYNKYEIDCHKAIVATLQRWADGIFFAKFKTLSKSGEEKFGKKDKKAIRTERVLYTQTTGAYPAGGRGKLGELPFELPLTYESYQSEINKLTKKEF